MTVTVKCQKCGAENRLGQLFCRECGAKLDLSRLTPNDVRQQQSIGLGALIVKLIRILITLALISILGLLCWTAPATGDASSAQGAEIIRGKLSALRGAVLARVDARESLDEADINAYINSILTGGAKPPGGLKLRLAEIRLDLHAAASTVLLKATLGPLPLTYKTDVTVTREANGRFIFTPGKVYIGHLPVPGPVRNKVLGQMSSTFLNLQEESALFNRLAVVECAEGAIKVGTKSK